MHPFFTRIFHCSPCRNLSDFSRAILIFCGFTDRTLNILCCHTCHFATQFSLSLSVETRLPTISQRFDFGLRAGCFHPGGLFVCGSPCSIVTWPLCPGTNLPLASRTTDEK